MFLPHKTDAERDTSKKESPLILPTQAFDEKPEQILVNENELLDDGSEHLSKITICVKNMPQNATDSSTKREECKSIVDSPPDCKPNFLENYKTPHSQRRTSQQKKKQKETSLGGGPPSNLSSETGFVLAQRKIPDAIKKWPACVDVWLNMVYNEEATLRFRNSSTLALPQRQQRTNGTFLPRMRAILVDWIMEVCEVYQMRRNTYYLAIDYVDRFLDHRRNIPKTQLQLVGVTCLFIAAKLEEIYPPKLGEFAYVCDGACTEKEILSCELLVLNCLDWDVNPTTPTNWLNLYMQIACVPSSMPQQLRPDKEDSACYNPTNIEIYFPVYSAYQFVRAGQVIDLFSFDPEYARFSYSVIAAAAMHLQCGESAALAASGFNRDHIDVCLAHMSFFHKVLRSEENPRLHSVLGTLTGNSLSAQTDNENTLGEIGQVASYRAIRAAVPNLVRDETHSMQTHCIDLEYYERAVVLRLEWLGFKIKKIYSKQQKVKTLLPETADNRCDSCKLEESTSNCSCNGKEFDENVSEKDDKEEEEQEEEDSASATVVMYQLQRIWEDNNDNEDVTSEEDILQAPYGNAETLEKQIDADNVEDKPPYQNSNIFALPIFDKQLVNFDAILSSVHFDCTDKMFMSLWRKTDNTK